MRRSSSDSTTSRRKALFERAVDHVSDAAEVVANLVDLADDVVDELQILILVGREVERGDVLA